MRHDTCWHNLGTVMEDFRAVVRALPGVYLVLSPDLRIIEVSDAYLAATQTRREELLGRDVFEVFPEDPAEAPDAGGAATARASLQRVLAERQPHGIEVRYPIRARDGVFEERFWKTLNTPVLDEDGNLRYIVHRAEDVTEAVHLQRASRRYHQLVDHAPDAMVIVGADSRIRIVNQRAELLFGYARDELIGQPIEVLIPERFRGPHALHVERFFAHPVARPMGSRLELFDRRKDASEIPIEVSLSPQRDADVEAVSASIRDITQRKSYEAAARLAAERLRSAVDSIQDAFALFDAEDRLVMCNSVFRRLAHRDAAEALVGKSYPEVLDAWIDDIDLPDDGARARFREERLVGRKTDPSATFDVRLRDGRVLRVVDRRTAEGGIVKTVWDITDDEQRAEELRDARATAEAASAAKSEFLSSMSHELRTPLNAVLGFAQLLMRDRREPLSPRHRDRVAHILGSGEHLLRLIDDVLDLSKIEAGRISLSLEPVAITDVLDEVSRTLEPIAARQKIALAVTPLPADLPMVHADRTRLAQILMNFGSNAVKYNRPEGRIQIEVSHSSPQRVRITVADTGIGIAAAQHAKLFQPFQRAGQETGPIEGTGIGLVITKRLAELMRGSVGFQSAVGEGSTFWVELPAEQTAVPRPPRAPPRETAPRVSEGRHLVLCVEDNPANIELVRDLMSTLDDIDLVITPTAELGVEFARARHPALVLMDINLPGMSGLDALRLLQADPSTKDIPVIALTAAASERDRQHGLAAGFYRYLSKPANLDELVAAIRSVLTPA